MNNIAVVGATSNIGRKLLYLLEEAGYSAKNVFALDDHEFEGQMVSFGDKTLEIECLQHFDFNEVDIAVLTLGNYELTKFYCEKIRKAGCIIVDTSSAFSYDKNVPLVIPEINPEELSNVKKQIISSPNSITIQTLLAIKPINDLFKIKRIVISTYQAVSENGKQAMDELFDSTKGIYENRNIEPKEFKKPIAFNVIPQVGEFVNGYEYLNEYEIREDIDKIYKNQIKTSVTCVNVPVFNCHSESINIECENEIDLNAIRDVYEDSESVFLLDNPKEYVYATPKDCLFSKSVFVSRLRKDESLKNGINMWIVGDNLVHGVALNVINILKLI